jgi:type II secretory pathway pseudopilin PulG
MKRKTDGFTIIELMVVIVLLFIAIALVALTASGVQAKNRNSNRQSDIDALRGQLEGYYAGTDTYPTRANLNDSTWRAKNLPKLKDGAIDDPNWKSSNPDCTVQSRAGLAAKPVANCYSYQVTSADGSSCDNDKTPCVHYTLTATLEGGDKYVKSSLN